MSTIAPRPGIMDITPYVGGESALAGVERVIKLASNEGAFGPSPKAMEAYRAAAGDLHRYPDGGCTALRASLAAHWGVPADRLVCGAGSDELLGMLCRAYAGPGDEVLYSAHGFLMYAIAAKSCGAKPVAAPEKNLKADVDALLARVTPRTRLVFIANPNNPTGSYLTVEELKRLHAGLRADVLLVVDSAYTEYVTRNDYASGMEMVAGADNVVVCRTFSKIYALGGLRVGWAYGPAHVVDVLNRVRNPFNVASAAQAAAVAALNDTAFAEKSRVHNDTWLAWTTAEIRKLGLVVPDSLGNFVLVRFPEVQGKNAAAADAFLRAKGLIVRRMVPYGLADCLRITIGLEDEMRRVVVALKDFLG